MRKEHEAVLRRAETARIRRMCGVKLRERKQAEELQHMVGVEEDIIAIVVKSRLRWFGHVKRREEDNGIRRVLKVEVSGTLSRGRSRMMWEGLVERNMRENGLKEGDWEDRGRWSTKVGLIGKNNQPS